MMIAPSFRSIISGITIEHSQWFDLMFTFMILSKASSGMSSEEP